MNKRKTSGSACFNARDRHMLDTIADDIDAEFCGEKVCAFRVSEFVRKWSPSKAPNKARFQPCFYVWRWESAAGQTPAAQEKHHE